jgi:hypothetical protein
MRRSGAEPAGVALTIHMSDDSGIGLLLAAFVDVLLGEGARRSRWIRVLKYTRRFFSSASWRWPSMSPSGIRSADGWRLPRGLASY